eukprot:1157337-Pelagomonas_calceolata.AAC.5
MSEPAILPDNQANQQELPQGADAPKQEEPDAPKKEESDALKQEEPDAPKQEAVDVQQKEEPDEKKTATVQQKEDPPPPKQVPDEQICARLHEVLKGADLNTLTGVAPSKPTATQPVLLGLHRLVHRHAQVHTEADAVATSCCMPCAKAHSSLPSMCTHRGKKRSGKRQAKAPGKAKGGFTKHSLLSPALSAFVGAETMSRPQVVKSVWDYIKKHNLQVGVWRGGSRGVGGRSGQGLQRVGAICAPSHCHAQTLALRKSLFGSLFIYCFSKTASLAVIGTLQDPKNKRNIICDDKLKTIFTPPITMFSMNKQLSKHCFQNDGGTHETWPRDFAAITAQLHTASRGWL